MEEEKSLPKKASITSLRELLRRLAGTDGSPSRTATAFGLGVFVGFLPVMPFQTGLALILAFLLRLNRPAVLLGTLVWQPFTMPLILAAEWSVGQLFFAHPQPLELHALSWKQLLPLLPGVLPVAAAAGTMAGAVVYWPLKRFSRQNEDPSVMQEGRG
jgi:uncharacterized protein (DUF2062 family)